MPRISVVTPLYNAEAYLEETVRSVLGQTFGDFEYLIVNDGSSDGSLALAQKLAAEDGRIRVIDFGKNKGYAAAVNALFGEAKGEFIAMMDADDICHPQRFEKQVAFLDSHPEMNLVGVQYNRLSPTGKVLRKTRNDHGDAALQFKLLFSVPMCNPTKMFRRSILKGLGAAPYDASMVGAPEYAFFVKTMAKGGMHVLPDYLFYYRIHPKSLSTVKKDKLMEETYGIALDYIFGQFPQLKAHREVLMGFIDVQRDNRKPITAEKVDAFCEGLDLLANSFLPTLNKADRYRVEGFVSELEAKTLLGRHKLYKKPALLLRWLTNRHNHLKWAIRSVGEIRGTAA